MSKTIQLRNVPDALHRKLKAGAALEGMTLSDYLIAQLRRSAEGPTLREFMERLARRSRVVLDVSPAAIIRAERDFR